MRELIAELPALSVAIPAISIALPIFSVLLLSAIFHWVFEPDNTPEETPDQDLDAADTQNFAIQDAKTPADEQISAHHRATDFNHHAHADDRTNLSKTSTNGSRLKVRNRHEHNNPENPTAHRHTDRQTPDSAATTDTNRRALTAMRLNTSTTQQGIRHPSESTTQAPNTKGSPTWNPTTSNSNSAFHHQEGGSSSADNLNATHQPANRNSAQQNDNANNTETENTKHSPFYKKPAKPSATSWLSKRTEHNPNTNQDGELRVSLNTARPPSSKSTPASAAMADINAPSKAAQSSSSATASIDNKIDSTRASFTNNLYLDLDKTKRNRSRSAEETTQVSSQSASDNHQTANTLSGKANKHSPVQNYATTSEATDSKSNALTNTALSNNKFDSAPATEGPAGSTNTSGSTITNGSADVARSGSSTANHLNDSSAKEHSGDLEKSQKSASSSEDKTQIAGTTTNSSATTTTPDINNTNSQSATATTPSTENNKAGALTTDRNRAIDSSDSTHHPDTAINNATTEAEKLSQTSSGNQQTENTLSSKANKHSPAQNYATTSEAAANKSNALTNAAHNNQVSSPSIETLTGSTNTTSTTIKNGSADIERSYSSTANHLNDSSAKEHQGNLARSEKTHSIGIDKTLLADTPTNSSAATTTPAINNTNSQSETVTTPSTENDKAGALTTAHNSATDSSDGTHHDAVNSKLTPADQSNPNHSNSHLSKHADQDTSATTETDPPTNKTGSSLDSTTPSTSANTKTSTGHELRPGQSDTSEQPTLQSRLHGDKNTTQTDNGPATTTPLSHRQDQSTNKHRNSTANSPSRSPERPKYQTAAKARYIPSSVEAQLQLKTPSTGKTKHNDNNSVTQSTTSNDIVDTKLLAEKDRLIEELEAKLKAFQQQAGTSKENDQNNRRPSPDTDSTGVASSIGIQGVINNTATSTAQTKNAALSNIDSTKASSTAATSTNTGDKLASTQPQNSQNAHAPATLLAAVKTGATNSQEIQFKDRYEKATEKLALNEHKIEKLQVTINRLQASGLVELQNEPQVPHERKTLLSKVRVMAPAG